MFKDLMTSALLFIVSIYFWINSYDLPIESAKFPRMVAILLTVLVAIYTLQVLKKGFEDRKKPENNENQKKDSDFSTKNLMFSLGASIVYVFSVNIIGFLLSTPIYLVSLMLLLGVENKKHIAIATIVSVALIYIGFKVLLNVPVPQGIILG